METEVVNNANQLVDLIVRLLPWLIVLAMIAAITLISLHLKNVAKKRRQIIWPSVQGLCDDLEHVYGLTGMLSAGLLLFSKLSPAEKEKAIKEAYSYDNKKPLV